MPRQPRIEFTGALYHVTSSGVARTKIFRDQSDCVNFLTLLGETSLRHNWICYAYCLMPNHYHLLIETVDPTLSRGMRFLNGVYTQRFNSRHRRFGHLFQGRFKAILIEKETYLLEVCRYIVLNPVRAGLVRSCEKWQWSSYCATLGLVPKPAFLAVDFILEQFGSTPAKARRRYVRFVTDRHHDSPWKSLKAGLFLGSNDFVRKLTSNLISSSKHNRIPKGERLHNRPSLKKIFKNSKERNRAIAEAINTWHYTLQEVGKYLGLHYSTISKIARTARDQTNN